jgi:hypothetical protein
MAKKTNEKKTNPFKVVSEQLPFYPDLTNEQQEPFFCTVVSETEIGDKPEKKMPVYILADVETGEEVFCLQSYSVKKVIEAAKAAIGNLSDAVIKLHFKGKTTVKGKPFNLFDTAYCSLEDYKAFKLAEEK